jgi:large subunit ribosomal protein L23
MATDYSTIKGYCITEKGSRLTMQNKYLFKVARAANKVEIKKAVEALYGVHVLAVNTSTVRGKKKRVRYVMGKTPDWKKAVVTLKKGETIEFK